LRRTWITTRLSCLGLGRRPSRDAAHCNPQSLYLLGHETLGWWDGASPGGADDWAYYLPDALGSVRQVTDETGAVTDAREWTPYGMEISDTQAGLGYTGESYEHLRRRRP